MLKVPQELGEAVRIFDVRFVADPREHNKLRVRNSLGCAFTVMQRNDRIASAPNQQDWKVFHRCKFAERGDSLATDIDDTAQRREEGFTSVGISELRQLLHHLWVNKLWLDANTCQLSTAPQQ